MNPTPLASEAFRRMQQSIEEEVPMLQLLV
jgi:hypothetical protein